LPISQFVRYRDASGTASWGLVHGDLIRELTAAPYLDHQVTSHTVRLADVTLLAPAEPPKIFAIGRNYKSHLGTRPQPTQPEVFYKPITCLQDPNAPILIPEGAENVHYEGELVLVIGRRLGKGTPQQAADAIFGVTCGNDVSERFWQNGGEGGAGKDLQWWRAKGSDTFGPCGPMLVSGLDFANLRLTTRLNGDIVQQQTTADLLFDSITIVAYISQNVTLQPGDLIYTGTPGTTKKLKPGDTVSVEIEGIGTLSNPVAAA
jgi:2-keto-4-pentenoate hydratase/2-oxohepta-3-ene-1,7-dioic acid hydratase in catechol pathway